MSTPNEQKRSNEAVDIDFLVSQLSVQNFRPIRGQLYKALAELRMARMKMDAVRAALLQGGQTPQIRAAAALAALFPAASFPSLSGDTETEGETK